MNKKGKLYLIPTTLGDSPPLEVLPISIKRAIESIDYYVVENEKTARHFIKKMSPRKSQPSLHLFALNKFTEATEIPSFLYIAKRSGSTSSNVLLGSIATGAE